MKTEAQKAHEAYLNDLGIGIGEKEAERRQPAQPKPKPRGQKPLYHEHFGPYFFWVITGKGTSEMDGTAAEYFGPTKCQQYPDSVTRWITELVNVDKDELTFNQYAYLEKLLQAGVQQYGNDAPLFQPVIEWLQEQVARADTYAELFSPLRYNVRTLADARASRNLSAELNLAKPLEPEEIERLAYYQRIGEQRAKFTDQEVELRQQLQRAGRQATEGELQRLAQLEKQIAFLALDQLDQLDMNRLQARASRKQAAADFKKGLEERLLQPVPSGIDLLLNFPGSFQPELSSNTGIIPKRIFFTLSELSREFDDNIVQYSTASSQAAYAAEQLTLFDANRPHIVRHFDRYSEMDTLKVSALYDVLTELRSRYEQYQKQKLKLVRPAVARPEVLKFSPQPISPGPTTPTNQQDEALKTDYLNKLFIPPFSSTELTELLQHLEVVDSLGHCITNELKGSGQGKKSRFTAAYRVLQREKLMEATERDAIWVEAFNKLYGTKLEDKATSHQLKTNGHPAAGCSRQFEQGVEKTKEWIKLWRESQESKSPNF